MSLMILGIGMAIYGHSSTFKGATMTAATIHEPPVLNIQDVRSLLPLDIRLDQEKMNKSTDTLETTIHEKSEVTKVDNYVVKKVPVVVERKVEVPVLYIATPKRDSVSNHSPTYEVHKVDGEMDIPVPSSLGVEPYEE